MKNFVFIVKKKFFFLSRTLLPLLQELFLAKKIKKRITFFDQKHGLTPLEKCDFNDFETISFDNQNRFLFYLQVQ